MGRGKYIWAKTDSDKIEKLELELLFLCGT